MKKIILLVLLILPGLAYSQYRANCFKLNTDATLAKTTVNLTINRDTTIALNAKAPIYGFSVSGQTILGNNIDSYVRIILRDSYDYEHLVYECFPMLADYHSMQFQQIALETIALDGVTPQSISIMVKNATVILDSYQLATQEPSAQKRQLSLPAILKQQNKYVVEKLNENLEKYNKTWRAGVTSVSQLTYEEKKDMFGGKVPLLYGFDYYKGGVFVMPDAETTQGITNVRSTTSEQYVSEWDWKNRHGKDWITPVKRQYTCGSCWAFSAISVLESYIKLYYNQSSINYDLSEQELVSCDTIVHENGLRNNGCGGGSAYRAFDYIKNYGIVNEDCFPYANLQVDCGLKCDNPSEQVFIEDYGAVYPLVNEDSIKKRLFISPISFGFLPWKHIINLIGYKSINYGDIYYAGDSTQIPPITIEIQYPIHENLIERTAWLVKNSWGTDWGNDGYGYVICSLSNINVPHYINGRITCNGYTDDDIVCEDADGDGYYFWGVNDIKPSYCPAWVPDIKDGHDADYTKGELLLKNTPIIGELETLNPDDNPALVISGNLVFSTRQSKYSHIRITSGGKLTVKNILNLFGKVIVAIESGGELVIDGGVVTNADINLASGGKITLKNGGKLVMRTNTNFTVPTGALADIQHGEILRSNDF